MGFEELPHTADWAARVWAADRAGLLTEAARAMYSLAGVVTGPGPRVKRVFESEGPDDESHLIAFLSELVYYEEQEKLAFTHFEIRYVDSHVTVEMDGAPIISVDKAIKAVTWHNLKINKTPRGLEVEIVFDV